MAKVNIPKIKLNNGIAMPALGFGTWLGLTNEDEFETTDLPKLEEALSYAIDIGYRHIDTAHLYRVEPEVGQIINKKIKQGVIKREDIFVTTKVWHHYSREADVEVSLRGSLRRLNLKYVDQLLVHWPMSISTKGEDLKLDYLETWRGFESVLKKGLTKSIGVSNFNLEQLKRLIKNSKVVPAVNQVEINLNLGQRELVDFCHSQNIAVVAFSPFGTMVPSRNYPNSPEPKLDNPTMMAIAKKHGKTVSQVALRFLYQRGIISIPKTVTKSRVLENASIFDFELSPEEFATVSKFDNGFRTVVPSFWQNHTHYPFEKISNPVKSIPAVLLSWKNGANLDID